MKFTVSQIYLSVTFVVLVLLVSLSTQNETRDSRSAAIGWFPFPHWSAVVKFPHEVCKTSNGEGICYHKKHCLKIGGISLGHCAQGFGVCCSTKRRCGTNDQQVVIKENLTTIITPEMSQRSCRFVFPKHKEVSQLRLDFETFQIASASSDGNCNADTFTVTGAANLPNGLTLCGNNTGKHMYLAYGDSENIYLDINLKNPGGDYAIKVTYIKERSLPRVPQECLQWYNAADGQVESFNYPQQQLNSQIYTVCIEPQRRSKSIQWRACDANSFVISNDLDCKKDFIQIFGNNRSCGHQILPISSIAKPFLMFVHFDDKELETPPFSSNFPAEDELSCEALSMHTNIIMCEWNFDRCTCKFQGPNNQGDDMNTGFCLKYSQRA